MATLTTRQSRFIDAYKGNATQAAIEAGFSARSARQHATRLLSNAAIQAEIQARQALDSQRLEVTRLDAIKGLLEAVEMAREQRNAMGMIAAWKTLATMLGFMAPQRYQVEVSAAADAEIGRYERLSDAELVRLIEAG